MRAWALRRIRNMPSGYFTNALRARQLLRAKSRAPPGSPCCVLTCSSRPFHTHLAAPGLQDKRRHKRNGDSDSRPARMSPRKARPGVEGPAALLEAVEAIQPTRRRRRRSKTFGRRQQHRQQRVRGKRRRLHRYNRTRGPRSPRSLSW